MQPDREPDETVVINLAVADIHIHIHTDGQASGVMQSVLASLSRIEQKMADETASLATLTAQVSADTDAENSAITLLGNLKTALDAAIASSGQDNNAALQALSTTIGNNDAALAAAVVQNTPAA